MVKGQQLALIFGIQPGTVRGVIGRTGLARAARHEYGTDGVPARIPRGIGIDAQQGLQRDLQTGFLQGLAYGGLLDRLADIHEPPGEGPAMKAASTAT